MENNSDLKRKLEYLEKENMYLKELLDKAGVPYEEVPLETGKSYDSNQGARIISKGEITEEDAKHFFSMFWGRTAALCTMERLNTVECVILPHLVDWKNNRSWNI